MKKKFTILLTLMFLATALPLVFVGASPAGVDTRDTPTYNGDDHPYTVCYKAASKVNKSEKKECKRIHKKCYSAGKRKVTCRRDKTSCLKKTNKKFKKEKKRCKKLYYNK